MRERNTVSSDTVHKKVVREFATALDRQDYTTARDLLASDCAYHIRSRVLLGPDAIIGSYKSNAEWGAANIDITVYKSSVERAPDGRFLVRFEDHIQHAGRRFTHTSRQFVTVNADSRIALIEHEDLPGAQEALEAFFFEAGVHRRAADI